MHLSIQIPQVLQRQSQNFQKIYYVFIKVNLTSHIKFCFIPWLQTPVDTLAIYQKSLYFIPRTINRFYNLNLRKYERKDYRQQKHQM